MKDDVKAMFLRDVANHRMSVELDQGVYRHLQLSRPGSSCWHFNVVTWPGYLSITGDCESFTFSRHNDMFEFFRQPNNRLAINTCYWAEKLVAQAKGGVDEYCEDSLRDYCFDALRGLRDEMPAAQRGEIGQRVIDEVLQADSIQNAHQRLYDFEVDGKRFFRDSWEWKLARPSFHFQWCCYAIVWAIDRYDEANKELLSV